MTEQQRQQLEALQKQLGDRGEDFALRYERQRLHAHPQVCSVRLIGRTDVGMGYDIISFMGPDSTTHDRYIEVKTYSGTPHFFLSSGEQAAARKYGTNYHIYLIDIDKVSTSGYQPLIIQNPIKNLSGQWMEKVQNREFVYIDPTTTTLPEDLDTSTVLVGCFNSNEHLNWIRHNFTYNVRMGNINGQVCSNDLTATAHYLLLYDCKTPKTYRMYSIKGTRIASRQEMISMNYPNPHAQQYLLYQLRYLVASPPLDIMQILRAYNDKLQRTSGTPIYMSGKALRQYLLNNPTQEGISQVRVYSNEGRPWSSVQRAKLEALYKTGTTIPQLAHEFHRPVEEIKQQLQTLSLL